MDGDWLRQFEQKLNLKGPELPSWGISKVPHKLRSFKKEAYSPLMVSIGPYHHGNLELQGMEEHKLQCMRNLLSLVEKPEETLHDCVNAVKTLVQKARECYAYADADKIKIPLDVAKLGEIMLVDGCFILDIFYRHIINDPIGSTDADDDALTDPTLRHDFVLLENQIPFFILEKLHDIFREHLDIPLHPSLTSLALSFLHSEGVGVVDDDDYYRDQQGMAMSINKEPNHLLDLLHQSLLPRPPAAAGYGKYPFLDHVHQSLRLSGAGNINGSNMGRGTRTLAFDACASELFKVGIQFQKISYESHSRLLLNIKFDRDSGIIEIPTLSIYEMETLLRNLIALEQCGFSNITCKSYHISSYALLLRSLIRSSEDVQLLEEKEIITTDLEKGGSVLDLISGICKNIHVKHFYFAQLCKEVNTYYKSRGTNQMESEWVRPLKEKLGFLGPTLPSPSISRVPNKLRSVKKEAYSPQMVSIGPYHHHGDLGLQGMEEHKRNYMLSLLRRTKDPEKTLDDCGQAIKDLDETVLSECYADKIGFDATKLGKILLVDGCFILEVLYRHVIQRSSSSIRGSSTTTTTPAVDHSNKMSMSSRTNAKSVWTVPTLQHDLVLLENQIPYFILEKLYKIFQDHLGRPLDHSLTSLIVSFFHEEVLEAVVMKHGSSSLSREPKHLLDLLHQHYCLPITHARNNYDSNNGNGGCGSTVVPPGFDLCASELLKSGIQLEKMNGPSHLFHIKFDDTDGVIKISPFSIHEKESLLRNLVAFEQCGFSSTFHISSYAVVLRSLVRSLRDVELLRLKGIITYHSGSAGDVRTFIDDICKNVVIKHFYFRAVCNKVNDYRNYWWKWHKIKTFCSVHTQMYLEDLKHNYFSTPWQFIAFLAALLLLILTGLQTFYAVHSNRSF